MGALGALYTQPVLCCMPTNAYHEHKEANVRTTPMVQTRGAGKLHHWALFRYSRSAHAEKKSYKPIMWTVRDLHNHHVNPDLWAML